jgi:hypothetical protein
MGGANFRYSASTSASTSWIFGTEYLSLKVEKTTNMTHEITVKMYRRKFIRPYWSSVILKLALKKVHDCQGYANNMGLGNGQLKRCPLV